MMHLSFLKQNATLLTCKHNVCSKQAASIAGKRTISSAKMPLMPLSYRWMSQLRPCIWYSRIWPPLMTEGWAMSLWPALSPPVSSSANKAWSSISSVYLVPCRPRLLQAIQQQALKWNCILGAILSWTPADNSAASVEMRAMIMPQNVVHACCKQDMHYDVDGMTASCVNYTAEPVSSYGKPSLFA